MSVVTEVTKTVNSDDDGGGCCKQRSEEVPFAVAVVAVGNSGAGDEGGKTEGRWSPGDQGRTKTDGGCCHCCERRGRQTTGTKETKRGWGDWVTKQKLKRLTRWRKVGKDRQGGRGMTQRTKEEQEQRRRDGGGGRHGPRSWGRREGG